MLLGIDHIVIVVADLEAAMSDYRKLGFTVVPGGRHPVGSYNGLIAFADGSYIELISFYRSSPDHRWWAALQRGEGLVDYCMRTDDLRGDTMKFRAAGVAIDDPVPWSRARPDGYQVKWRLSLARGEHRGVAPFLIEDETPREERVPREIRHANGAAGIGTMKVAVEETASVRKWCEAVLSARAGEIERAEPSGVGFSFAIGPHRLEFIAPNGRGRIADWLESRGGSPFAATLRGEKKAPPMDLSLTHGAALEIR